MPTLLVVAAVALRVAWVLLVPTRPVGDFAMYFEAAGHVLETGAFDPGYVYMPGYVLLLAGLRALGGGVLAAKLVGAVLGGLGAWPVHVIGARLHGPRAGAVAAALYAIWPGGIVSASLLGTDGPAVVLLLAAVAALYHDARLRPLRGAALFGLFLGLAALVRAVALPLVALSFPVWLAHGAGLRRAAARTAIGAAVALVVLAPWGARNALRYGELFLTDSHGGITALLGANPNTDGAYSYELYGAFTKLTGLAPLTEPHREGDRRAYELAATWMAFDPIFSAALAVRRAERLFDRERVFLYWPVLREGALPPGRGALLLAHRLALERAFDLFGFVVAGAWALGLGIAVAGRRWGALALLPFQAALVAAYALFFGEARYRMPIEALAFPIAASGLVAVAAVLVGPRGAARGRGVRRAPGDLRDGPTRVAAAGALAAIFLVWPALGLAAAQVRAARRWAAVLCTVDGVVRMCALRPSGSGPSPLRGTFEAVGIGPAPAAFEVHLLGAPLPPGTYRFEAQPAGAPPPGARLVLGGREAVAPSDRRDGGGAFAASLDHPGGPLAIDGRFTADGPAPLWLTAISLAPGATPPKRPAGAPGSGAR
jgi:hypothetical protein